MKRAFRSLSTLGLVLLLGAGTGIVLQKYFDVSKQAGNLLRAVGLYKYAYGPTEVLKARANQPTIPIRLQGRLKLYVLIGQSNMVGKAAVPENISTSANIFTFGNDYRWQVAKPPIDSSENQVDLVSADDDAGFGPAFPFAQTLIAQNNNQIIGLIPCARDGSSITNWEKSPSDDSLYGSCLKRVRAASTMGTVSGILFFQGEADAIDPDQFPSLQPDAGAWAEKFATFAFNFRTDIGNPALPLVYAQLGQPENLEGLPNWDAVQQQQESLQIPNAGMIVTEDLPMDGIHFTADSYRVIGQRFADAIAQIGLASTTTPDRPNGESPAADAAQTDSIQ
ncbi:MAG: sialate O-acetylesterase [Cyanobacteria bacterium J06631_9]